MRLRTRYFLISWPLVVLAIAAVAFGVDRYTVVELDRIERAQRPARDRSNDAALADSLVAQWERSASAPPLADLARRAGSDSSRPQLVVIDSTGKLIASTDSALGLLSPPASAGGLARFVRRALDG